MTNVTGTFLIPIYNKRVYVVVAKDAEEALGLLPQSFRKVYDDMGGDPGEQACYLGNCPNYAMIFLHGKVDLGTIDHEIGHVCRKLLDDIGFTITASNDEPLAYLEEWMTNRVHKLLKK